MKHIHDPASHGFPPEPSVPPCPSALRGNTPAPRACLTASQLRRLSGSLDSLSLQLGFCAFGPLSMRDESEQPACHPGEGGDRSELTARLDVPSRSLQMVVGDGYVRERTEADQ